MAKIVSFAEKAACRPARAEAVEIERPQTAAILLFTGVWQEKIADAPEPTGDDDCHRRRSRI